MQKQTPERKANQLQARRFDFQLRQAGEEGEPQELWVEGYAAQVDSPTVLFECEGVEYREIISRGAFDDCNMGDVIFNYNHGGKVVARTRNKTLEVSVDERGLFVRARLDGTDEGRRLYEEIQKGYIDRMSFRFKIEHEDFDGEAHTWTVQRIKRLYDVSAVDIPAYDDTSIEARRADAERFALDRGQEAAAAAALRQRVLLKTKLPV